MTLRIGRTLAAAVLLAGLATAAALGDMPEAPDGHPGLGTERTARQVSKYLRKPPRSDEEDILSWAVLPTRVQVLWDEYERRLRAEGAFDVVPPTADDEPADLDALFAAYREGARVLPATLAKHAEHADTFARLHADLRFRILADLREPWELERRELLAGLAVLNGMHDGYVVLTDDEARKVCERVDLAAARLRSLALDLDTLSRDDDAGPGVPTAERIERWLSVARMANALDRKDAIESLLEEQRRVRERMEQQMFHYRLAQEVDEALRRREAARQDAARLAREAAVYAPWTEEGKAADEAIAGMKTSHRHAYALRLSVEGLGIDPLNDTLAFYAGVSSDFTHDERVTRPWFDRFLAIRGVRTHGQGSTTVAVEPRDEWERHAFERVQGDDPLGLPR